MLKSDLYDVLRQFNTPIVPGTRIDFRTIDGKLSNANIDTLIVFNELPEAKDLQGFPNTLNLLNCSKEKLETKLSEYFYSNGAPTNNLVDNTIKLKGGQPIADKLVKPQDVKLEESILSEVFISLHYKTMLDAKEANSKLKELYSEFVEKLESTYPGCKLAATSYGVTDLTENKI